MTTGAERFTYIEKKRILAHALHRFDEECRQL